MSWLKDFLKEQTMSGEYDSLNAQNKRTFMKQYGDVLKKNYNNWKTTNVTLPLMRASFLDNERDSKEYDNIIKKSRANALEYERMMNNIPKRTEDIYSYYGYYYPKEQGLEPKYNINPFNKVGTKLGQAIYNMFGE